MGCLVGGGDGELPVLANDVVVALDWELVQGEVTSDLSVGVGDISSDLDVDVGIDVQVNDGKQTESLELSEVVDV